MTHEGWMRVVNGNGAESHAVAMARQQGEIEALQERLGRLEAGLRESEALMERRLAEIREEVRRGVDAQTEAVSHLSSRLDATLARMSGRVPPEIVQRLAEARAREAASRAWAVALFGALAVLGAALLAILHR